MEPTKRELREAKRVIKRRGNHRLRRQVKQALAADPAAAVEEESGYGRLRSSVMNGMDHDAKRRRHGHTDRPGPGADV
jgi:hypothetical protein